MRTVLIPMARMVFGDLYSLLPRNDKDGKPKIGKDGKPSLELKFAVAIKKGTEDSWFETTWGKEIKAEAVEGYPKHHLTPTFAWKVVDGDSPIPNKKGKAPNENPLNLGHWILWLSQGWLPKITDAKGNKIDAEGYITSGDYVKLILKVKANGSSSAPSETPGVYLNPEAVGLAFKGQSLAVEVDTSVFGEMEDVMPDGALSPSTPEFSMPPPAAKAAPAPTPPPPPNYAFVDKKPHKTMTAKAGGYTYDQMVAGGWNDDTLISNGYMLP